MYLADIVSKSAEYCHATAERSDALMLLCEAALGKVYHTAHGKFVDRAMLDEAGFHSVHGLGRRAPHAAYAERLADIHVPLGKESSSGVSVSELEHNEFIVVTRRVRNCSH